MFGTVWCTCHDHVSVTPCCVFHVACFCYTLFISCVVFCCWECVSCVASSAHMHVMFIIRFLRMYRCCFHVTCHFTCYVTSMSCYMLCIGVFLYPKMTPISPHWPFFDPFWRTEKTMLPFGHPQKYPVFSVEGSPTLWHRAPKHPQNRPKMTSKIGSNLTPFRPPAGPKMTPK